MFKTLYESRNITYEELEMKSKLPKFQRELVWSKNDKLLFLDSVSKGYPFGSLLISENKESNKEQWIVIDGLQRFTTLKDFKRQPEAYMWIYVKIPDTKRLSCFLHNNHSWSVPHPK